MVYGMIFYKTRLKETAVCCTRYLHVSLRKKNHFPLINTPRFTQRLFIREYSKFFDKIQTLFSDIYSQGRN